MQQTMQQTMQVSKVCGSSGAIICSSKEFNFFLRKGASAHRCICDRNSLNYALFGYSPDDPALSGTHLPSGY